MLYVKQTQLIYETLRRVAGGRILERKTIMLEQREWKDDGYGQMAVWSFNKSIL